MKYFLFLLLSVLTACGNSPDNSNGNSKPANSNNNANRSAATPTPEVSQNTPKTELEAFVNKHYKGWKLEGQGAYADLSSCTRTEPCSLHLTKGKEDKVISVIVEQFKKSDGTLYWLVYEPSKLDLLRGKIESEKDTAVELAKADLSFEDCEGVIDAYDEERRSASYEPPPDDDPY